MQNQKRIVIVGGGPGGLTLARILATRGIASTVLELDAHPLVRPQGGSLDLHAESGQHALRLAGLEQGFREIARYDDQEDRLYDEHGALVFERTDTSSSDRPEVDRTQLRALLLESLPPGTVRWNSKLRTVEPLADGRFRLIGERESFGDFDLVIGADGAWSKVRPVVSPHQPGYSRVTFIELSIEDVDTRHPAISKLVGRGKIFALGIDKGIIAQRNSGAQVRIYLGLRVPEDWLDSGVVDFSSPASARVDLKNLFLGWSPSLLALIEQSNDVVMTRRLVALPIGHRWAHRPGVTLLGDAAHVMSPFSGEGVNIAMLDASELALRLVEDHDWQRAVVDYEQAMFVRAEQAAAGAAEGLDTISAHGLEKTLAHYRSR